MAYIVIVDQGRFFGYLNMASMEAALQKHALWEPLSRDITPDKEELAWNRFSLLRDQPSNISHIYLIDDKNGGSVWLAPGVAPAEKLPFLIQKLAKSEYVRTETMIFEDVANGVPFDILNTACKGKYRSDAVYNWVYRKARKLKKHTYEFTYSLVDPATKEKHENVKEDAFIDLVDKYFLGDLNQFVGGWMNVNINAVATDKTMDLFKIQMFER